MNFNDKALELIELIADNVSECSYMSYSGRGSFGAVWPAFACPSIGEFSDEALRALELVDDADLRESIKTMRRLLGSMTTDSLGRGQVVYWRIALPEDHPLYDVEGDDDYDDDY